MENFVNAVSILVATGQMSRQISLYQNQGSAAGRPDAVTESIPKLINSSLSLHRAAAGSVAVTGVPW
jgi:hypothetical protein